MKITADFEIAPIRVPPTVEVVDVSAKIFHEPLTVSIYDLPIEAISDLADKFREDLFLEVGKCDPKQPPLEDVPFK